MTKYLQYGPYVADDISTLSNSSTKDVQMVTHHDVTYGHVNGMTYE